MIKKYFKNLKGDLFGGLTAGIVALPLALAFGVSSGLGPSAGLYGAIFISFFAALFGGTNTQISGPTAPMTAVSMVIITNIITSKNGELAEALPIILFVFLLAGIFQIGLGIIGLGKYIRYIPYPVISGFMTAIGVIIILTQILPTLGYYPKNDVSYVNQFKSEAKQIILEKNLKSQKENGVLVLDDFERSKIREFKIEKEAKTLAAKKASGALGSLKIVPRAIKQINWLEFILAISTILIIYGFKKITTSIPSTLVALLLVSGIAIYFDLNYVKIQEIPSGIPTIQWDMFINVNVSSLQPYILTAITLSLLGAIDSLLTSIVADNMTKTKHKSNKELIGQGIGNSIAAVFGGIPGAGATIRTVVNINAGGKTKLSGMVSSIVLLVIMLLFASIASKIPAAVLAGILITVGIGVMDYRGLKSIPHMPKDIKLRFIKVKFSSEVLIMITVLLLSSFWDLIYAVAIGLIMASLVFMKKIGDIAGRTSSVKPISDELALESYNLNKEILEEVFIKDVNGPLFFGSTSNFRKSYLQIPERAKLVILRLNKMSYMDQTGLYAMEDLIQELRVKKIQVLFVRLQNQPQEMMEHVHIIPEFVPENHIFDSLDECFRWLKNQNTN